MSAQISNHNFTSLGRMYAKQNAPAVYTKQKFSESAETEQTRQVSDMVSLSPFAPKPLSASLFEEALDTSRMFSAGENLSTTQIERLREDRVLHAISALALLGENGETGMTLAWPGGLPTPTSEEMEAARRRLSQRLQFDKVNGDPEEVQFNRMELLKKLRERDSAVSQETGTAAASA